MLNFPKRRLRSERGCNPFRVFLAALPGWSPAPPLASAQLGGKPGLEFPPLGLDPVLGGEGGTKAASAASRRRVGAGAEPVGATEEEEVQVQPQRRSGLEEGESRGPASPRPSPASSLTPGWGPIVSRPPGAEALDDPRVDYGGEIPGE